MRLVTRAELRSVICGGSMVTGSARRPITMASLGGAAPAPEVRATARIARAIFKVRRIVMGCSFGRQFASSRSPAQSGPESWPIELCAQQGVPLTDESPAEAIALRAQSWPGPDTSGVERPGPRRHPLKRQLIDYLGYGHALEGMSVVDRTVTPDT